MIKDLKENANILNVQFQALRKVIKMIKLDCRKLSGGVSCAICLEGNTEDILIEYTTFIKSFKKVILERCETDVLKNETDLALTALTLEACMKGGEINDRDRTATDIDGDDV